MSSAARPTVIPPEVLAREARLSSVLVAMARAGSREARPLQALRAAAAAGDGAVADALVDDLIREGLAEEALAVLREIRRP